jgi:hypothetical protein
MHRLNQLAGETNDISIKRPQELPMQLVPDLFGQALEADSNDNDEKNVAVIWCVCCRLMSFVPSSPLEADVLLVSLHVFRTPSLFC